MAAHGVDAHAQEAGRFGQGRMAEQRTEQPGFRGRQLVQGGEILQVGIFVGRIVDEERLAGPARVRRRFFRPRQVDLDQPVGGLAGRAGNLQGCRARIVLQQHPVEPGLQAGSGDPQPPLLQPQPVCAASRRCGYGEGGIHVETLLDRQATRGEILARLEALSQRVKASDHVMIFVASHGVLLDDGYRMVTSDYGGELSPANTLSADELVDRSRRIPALSQWLVFDTCHAGGLGSFFAGLYDARVQVMARQSGMHVFAASNTTQEALDGYQGNGLFTHTLLTGLGEPMPADANHDRKVTVSELGRYAREQTRRIARSMDHAQDPLIVHQGEDRVIAQP